MKIFISYPRERVGEATEIQTFLEGLGLDVWRDKDQIVGGEAWRHEREEAQRAAEFIVHVFSNEMLTRSGEVHREIRQTLDQAQNQPLHSIYYVVVRVDDVPVTAELTDREWIDYFTGDWKLKLARSVERKFGQLNRPTAEKLANFIKVSLAERQTAIRKFTLNEMGRKLEVEYPQYTEPLQYLEYVNATIASKVLGEFYRTKGDFDMLVEPAPERTLGWEVRAEEVFRRSGIISIRLWHYYDAGGVHPSYGATTLNFFGDRSGLLDIDELFAFSTEARAGLINLINDDLNTQLNAYQNEDGTPLNDPIEVDIATYGMPQEEFEFRFPEPMRAYNISDSGITFTLSEFAGLPHALGVHEVKLTWEQVRPWLSEKPTTLLRPLLG